MISVILPVYNAENYLHVCLNSVLKQTYSNFEIICINDNSTDTSLEILEYFTKKTTKIQIINNNIKMGFGFCRNKGLKVAKGKYIFFLEANDWISFNAFELLMEVSEESDLDMTIFKSLTFDDKNYNINKIDSNQIKHYQKNEKIFDQFSLNKKDLFNSTNFWNTLYLSSFLKNNNINFPNDDLNGNYYPFFYKCLINAKRITILDKYLYNHREIPSKIINIKNSFDKIHISYLLLDIFMENPVLYQYYKQEILRFIIYNLHEEFKHIDSKYKEEYYNEIVVVIKNFIKDYGICRDIENNIDKEILDFYNYENIYTNVMNNPIKITVIIPVYNVENYLKECLDSIINQTLKDIEIICINDGSTDKSLNILETYAKKDKRIKIINQNNHGSGYCRNIGIKEAKGKYISFVDSDDFIPEETLELAYNNLNSNNSEIVIFKIIRYDGTNMNYNMPAFPLEDIFKEKDFDNFTFTYKDIKNHVLNSSFIPCAKVYKKNFLEKYNLKFPTGIIFEDVPFHALCLLKSSKISFIPKFLYYYRTNNLNSNTHNHLKTNDIIKVCNIVEKELILTNHINEFKAEFIMFKIKQMSQYIELANSEKYNKLIKKEFDRIDINAVKEEIPQDLIDIYYKIKKNNT